MHKDESETGNLEAALSGLRNEILVAQIIRRTMEAERSGLMPEGSTDRAIRLAAEAFHCSIEDIGDMLSATPPAPLPPQPELAAPPGRCLHYSTVEAATLGSATVTVYCRECGDMLGTKVAHLKMEDDW